MAASKKTSPYGQKKFGSINEYHTEYPLPVRKKLDEVRKAISSAAPKATEIISYNMPAFKGNKTLVYYAANKEHIGLYPMPSAIKKFSEELKDFKTSKGAIQLPLSEPMPLGLIKKIVRFRVEEDNLSKHAPSKKTR